MNHQSPTVFDTAAYIMREYAPMAKKYGPMTTMKLQKLVYYSQAWSLVWDGKPLFHEPIKAWAHGPVVPKLFNINKGRYRPQKIDPNLGDPENITGKQKETVDIIVRDYGKLDPEMLMVVSHREPPWQLARARHNLGPEERGDPPILEEDMRNYYSSRNQNDNF